MGTTYFDEVKGLLVDVGVQAEVAGLGRGGILVHDVVGFPEDAGLHVLEVRAERGGLGVSPFNVDGGGEFQGEQSVAGPIKNATKSNQ